MFTVSFWGDKIVLKLDSGDDCTTLLKPIDLCTLRG